MAEPTAIPPRFWALVNQTDTCWSWTGNTSTDGYGRFFGHRIFGTTLPHRISWMDTHGPIPSGLELDHLCQNRVCVNPDHLELVTHQENIRRAWARRTECRNGHDIALQVSDYRGGQRCLVCRRIANAASARRRRRGPRAA